MIGLRYAFVKGSPRADRPAESPPAIEKSPVTRTGDSFVLARHEPRRNDRDVAKFAPVATPPSRVVTRDMTAMIYRLLAFYSLVGLLPSLPRAVEQIPRTEVWASVVFGG